MLFSQSNYNRSNKITTIKIPISQEAIDLANALSRDKATVSARQQLGEALLDELCDAAKIDIIKLKISDANQYHRKRDGKVVIKKYGVYHPKTKFISIANRTAVRGQTLAAKTFTDTLLHEWLHHYDTYKLKLRSIHSKGFYLRLNDLKEKLKIK
ncbi:MAG: hypothetical protein AAB358_03805 [Patescibacteria group bacterium]